MFKRFDVDTVEFVYTCLEQLWCAFHSLSLFYDITHQYYRGVSNISHICVYILYNI